MFALVKRTHDFKNAYINLVYIYFHTSSLIYFKIKKMDDFFGTLNQTTSINNNNLFENDPAADFLAREQAELDKIESISNDIKV